MPNGAGTVYKLSGKRRRPWVACITDGFDDVGKQKRRVIGYYAEQLEARDALSAYRKNPTPKYNITLKELYDEWIDPHCKGIVKSTARGYRAAWKHLDDIKNMRVREIRSGHFQAIIDSDTVSQLSYSSQAKVKLLMGMLMNYAKQNDIVMTNYAEFVKLPKKEKSTRDAFVDTELAIIEKAVNSIPGVDAILVLCYTGFRVDEFLSLTQFAYNDKMQTLISGSKTEAGRERTIPIHSKLQPIIKRWASKKGDYLYCKANGGRYSVDYFRKKIYYPALDAIGAKKVRRLPPHCTRHTFASLLHAAGASTLDIQRLIGHTDYAVTANVYTHVNIEGLRAAIASVREC
jgi:integrase